MVTPGFDMKLFVVPEKSNWGTPVSHSDTHDNKNLSGMATTTAEPENFRESISAIARNEDGRRKNKSGCVVFANHMGAKNSTDAVACGSNLQ